MQKYADAHIRAQSHDVYNLDFNPWLACLRGVSVLLVLFFHTSLPGLQSGYLGVDIFFALSGYFITTSLLKSQSRGQLQFRQFYWRRFLRLFPALALVVLTFVLVSPWLSLPQDRWNSLIAALGYVSNWTRVAWPSVPAYFGHSWSLAVEEQFYLLWPIILGLTLKFCSLRQAALVALGIAIASASTRAALAVGGTTVDRLYNGLDVRADGLLLGCALALATFKDPIALGKIKKIAAVGLLFLGPAFLFLLTTAPYDAPWMFHYGYFLAALAATGIIAVSIPRGPVRKIKWLAPLLFLGEISYGLYLWHYPITLEMRLLGYHPIVQSVCVFGLSTVAASLSYYFVERPISRMRNAKNGDCMGAVTLVLNLSAMAFAFWFFWH
jgi:peptidoglycan/LPS O-acetylase OafA/YrhL